MEDLNEYQAFFSYRKTWDFNKFIHANQKIIFLVTGNQRGKTAMASYNYVMRVLGVHPVPKKNVVYFECEERKKLKEDHDDYIGHKESFLEKHKSIDSATWTFLKKPEICPECGASVVQHERQSRTFRFASETLPGQAADLNANGLSAEVKNTQYPAFKKWLPPHLIKKDITFRSPSMILLDPYGGPDIVVDFVSYNQSIQSTAGTQRLSCVAEGQRVLMADGVWKNIEEIKEGDELICQSLGGHGDRQKTNKVKKAWHSGKKEVLRFNCQKGISFEVTGDHLIMIPNVGKAKYIKAENLKVGDSVTCRTSKIVNDFDLGWKSKILGVLLGDGTITKKQVTPKFTCKNDKLAEKVREILPASFNLRKVDFKANHSPDYFISGNGNNELTEWLREIGVWGCNAGNKFIPDTIFRQCDNGIKNFLSYIYSCDGWATGHVIGYCSTSYRLAQDIFLLLRRFGIRSTINEREFDNGWNKQWHIIISQARDVIRFCNKIGIIAKEDSVSLVKKEAKRRLKSRIDSNYFSNSKVKEYKIPQRVKIKSIERVGIKNVYDISMEETRSPRNNFLISGGVVVHNCWYDEEPSPDFREEQLPRLLAEDGDEILTLTPANHICFDERTKVLSENGWVGHNEIKEGDNVLTLNMDNGSVEWEQVDLIYRNDFNGELSQLKCQGFDALVTDNHRWPVEMPSGKRLMKETKDLKGHHKIYRAIKNNIENEKIYDDWFVELAGWFLTDGAMVPDGNKIWLCQSLSANEHKCNKIREIVKNCADFYETSNKYHVGEPCDGVVCKWYIGGKEAKRLRELFPTRELNEKFLFQLTKDQQYLLYNSLVDGDGCRTKDGDKLRGTLKTIDAFLALCVLLGKRATRTEEITVNGTVVYKSYIQKDNGRYKPFTHVASLKKDKVLYNGIVWCPHTKNNTLIAKRNGTVYYTGNTWTYDTLYEQAEVYYRTKTICNYLRKDDYDPKQIEETGNKTGIAVIQAATDDNPILDIDTVDELFSKVDDPDILAIRRYGVFKQVSGRIFKDFEYQVHYIPGEKYFPQGIPHSWTHARGIDYHPQTPWACGFISISDTNEAFIWGEYNPSPEKYSTEEIAKTIGMMSEDYKFTISLADPLIKSSKRKETQTRSRTLLDDMNDSFRQMNREGICTGGFWSVWDTKGEKGRDEIRKRLCNAKICGKPFNNEGIKDGRKIYLPTLWVLDSCPIAAKSMRQWRWEQYTDPKSRQTKGEKNSPEQKWSHFNMVWEACFKHPLFKAKTGGFVREERVPQYFRAR